MHLVRRRLRRIQRLLDGHMVVMTQEMRPTSGRGRDPECALPWSGALRHVWHATGGGRLDHNYLLEVGFESPKSRVMSA